MIVLYINELPNCSSHSRVRLFAEGTHMTYSSNNINDISLYFIEELLNLSEWLSATTLTINQTKTEFQYVNGQLHNSQII